MSDVTAAGLGECLLVFLVFCSLILLAMRLA